MRYPLFLAQKRAAYAFFVVTGMVFVMVVLGGLTRLTGSGLSIVEWNPVMGFIPPFNEIDWMMLFDQYRHSPEFIKVNSGMTLPEFKQIFWLEFIHRLWGRLIGLVLLLPTILILRDSRLRREYTMPVILLWILGLGQGVLGWYMVKSGLVTDPQVSPYRLTAHLLMGFLIVGVSLQTGLNLFHGRGTSLSRFKKRIGLMVILVLTTASFGGLVAGLKAGVIYNTFPKMDANWLPEAMWFLTPLWKNLTENAGTVQFIHRLLATLTFITVALGAYTIRKQRDFSVKRSSQWVILIVGIQFFLGVLTLLFQVPVHLAALHQAVAILLFMSLIKLHHTLRQAYIR